MNHIVKEAARRYKMATKTICDRCGKDMKEKNTREHLDMCKECAKAYDDFMDNKEEKKGFL